MDQSTASVARGEQAVNGAVKLKLEYHAAAGAHHIVWVSAPVPDYQGVTLDMDFATVWNLDNESGLRAVVAQMIAGPQLYEAIKEAHHELVCVNGLYASDRYPSDVHWRIAIDSTLGVLDAALKAAETLVIEGEVG